MGSASTTLLRDAASFDVFDASNRDTLRQLAATMDRHDCGFLVVAGRDGAAVVSERDIIRALAAGADPDAVWAVDVARHRVLTLPGDASIADAATLMAAENVRHVVVEDGGRIGIVSVRDVLEPLLGLLSH